MIKRKNKAILCAIVSLTLANTTAIVPVNAMNNNDVVEVKSYTSKKEMVAKVDDLNVRAGSGTKHKVLGKLNKGDKVTVIQTLSNGWVKIEYKGGFGYVSNVKGAYLQEVSSSKPESKKEMVAKVDDLNVRAGSSTKHKVLGKLNKGDKVTVIQTLSNGWIKIEYKGGFGYVSNVKGAYLQPIDDTQDKKSADKVISLIDSLNVKITLADKADIIKAREAYDALSEKAKDLVTNLNKLTDAEKEIARLEAEVDSVKDMLANLPSPDMLTVDDIDTINALSTAYNKLTPEQKKLAIPDETVLTEYMLVCDKLEKAQPIIKMIDALPKVNAIKIADKNKVQEVRKAYNNATTGSVNAGVAKYITNYNKLVKLENKIAELEAIS